MIRSANTNEMTPPKLIPPFQSTAASGTLPIEQTNETTETAGPTSGPHTFDQTVWSVRNTSRSQDSGTQAANAPAMSSPPAMSRQTAAQSMAKYPAVEVKPAGLDSRRHSDPPSWTDMSIAACPSIDPASPRSAWRRAACTTLSRMNTRNATASSRIISGPPTNSASVNRQPSRSAMMMPSSTTRL